MNASAKEFWNGVRNVLPILVGVAPFGMIYGVLGLDAGIPARDAQAMSAVLFAGSSQFVAAQLYAAGTPALVMIVTIVVINLRHGLYSASIAPHLLHLPVRWKTILAYLLTDEAYAVSILNYQKPGDNALKHFYFLGAGLGLWTIWQISTAVGILLGAVIPSGWSLDFTLALTFIALVVPALKDRAVVAAAVTAGVVAVAAYPLPYKLWIVLAALAGITAGLLLERKS